MRTFELRVYKLRTKEALDFYREVVYPRHLNSFPLFGIEVHGFFAIVSYAEGDEPGEVARRYMQSAEFAGDTRNFDVSGIVGVESTILIPSTGSPLM